MARTAVERTRIILFALVTSVYATPNVAFPFNSQVPNVARVGQAYLFQFSASTFAPQMTNFTYSLSGQPAWLAIDSTTRTLSGIPSYADTGASTFTLTAADSTGAGYMRCTLIVSADPPPHLEGNIGEQLAATGNLSSNEPPTVTVSPSSPFRFEFQQDSFIDIVQRRLYYYATLADHTPLPAWLEFDSQSLIFSGTAPGSSGFPQSWNIELIASDVAGFGATTASFVVSIGQQNLVFVPGEQTLNISTGMQIQFTALQNQLFRNGLSVSLSSLASAQASALPTWMRFDASTLALIGVVPSNVSDCSVVVTVQDDVGDSTSAIINLINGNASLFTGSIGSLTANIGQAFSYHFPDSLFSLQSLDLSVTVPPTATWLTFNATARELQGTVPTGTSPGPISATLTAKSMSPPTIQTKIFSIDVKASPSMTSSGSPSSGISTTQAVSTNTAWPTQNTAANSQPSQASLRSGIIAAIVILSIVAAVAVIVCLKFGYRRKRQLCSVRQPASHTRRTISRPILQREADAITITTEMQTDVEKTASASYKPRTEENLPPQIALDLSSEMDRKKSRWIKRISRISHTSSLGNGEDTIRADLNIPEWGGENSALQEPHDSFSVPAEIARSSQQLSQKSPRKRALKRLRDRNLSRQSIGLGTDTAGANLKPRLSLRSHNHRRGRSSYRVSAIMELSSQASLSTRGTSVLSTRAAEFPRPPRGSTCISLRSIPTLAIAEADKRKSIRMVNRRDSVADNRSLQEKRQSFIRNRASTSWQSPLFAHGSRASISNRDNGSSMGSIRRSRNSRDMLATYSESSSLEPQEHESRRLSVRARPAFLPNYPRVVSKSSLSVDDKGPIGDDESSWESDTTSSWITEEDLAAELALPPHERSWVLPGEASPTPPPAPLTLRQASSARHSTPTSKGGLKQNWKHRLQDRSPLPLATAVAVPLAGRSSLTAQGEASQARRSRLSEPVSLVSNDSFGRAKVERPRLVHNNSKRPVSVEEVKRSSSLRAETGTETDTQAGSDMWEEMEGRGLMQSSAPVQDVATRRSDQSGPAFL